MVMTEKFMPNTTMTTEIPKTDLFSLVGNTPLLPLNRIGKRLGSHVQIYAKAEWFNPGGSVKDRAAMFIIQDAVARGLMTPGKRLLDSTSGNTGIAYATLGVLMGIPVTLVIPENASPERIKILSTLGAELVLTDSQEGTDGAMRVAKQMAKAFPEQYFYANQYDNPANWRAHFNTTGPEIWEQTEGQITHLVAGMGTAGTITGTTRYLKSRSSLIKSVAFHPDSPFHGLEGLKHMPTARKPGNYDHGLPDETRQVATEDAYEMVRRLGQEEGLFVGISSGAAAVAALTLAEEIVERGRTGVVVTVFPDAGYKYLTSDIWSGKR
jgi:cysteine synthase B